MTTQNIAAEASQDTPSRVQRIRAATHGNHDALDKRIMRAEPFASRDNYSAFLRVQHDFHAAIDGLYDDSNLIELLPDLASRRRLALIRQDMIDLGAVPPEVEAPGLKIDFPAALGWLYTAEGSNLGAAFLLKAARGLELSETFGARHLAGHSDGRGLHWKTFTTALDAIPLKSSDEEQVMQGARDAFDHVHLLVVTSMPAGA